MELADATAMSDLFKIASTDEAVHDRELHERQAGQCLSRGARDTAESRSASTIALPMR